MECPRCQEKSVDTEQHYCQEQLVCTSCGHVFYDVSFASTIDEGSSFANPKNPFANIPWDKRKHAIKTNTAAYQCGIEKINYLSAALCLSSINRSTALKLYENAVVHPKFSHIHVEKKKALAACVVYTTLRQNNFPTMLSHLCALAQVNMTDFNSVFQPLIHLFKIDITSTPTEESVPVYLTKCRMDDKNQVIRKTIQIIQLAHELWLTYSKKPDGIISAAAYLAWSSIDIGKRANVRYPNFCFHVGLPEVPMGKLRCRELERMFSKLAAEFPWIDDKKLKKRPYFLYCLNDVLKNSRALSQSVIAKEKASEEDEWRVFLPPPRLSTPKHRYVSTPEDDFAIKVSNSPELTDADIPDEKLHFYIRSSEEIEQVKMLSAQKH